MKKKSKKYIGSFAKRYPAVSSVLCLHSLSRLCDTVKRATAVAYCRRTHIWYLHCLCCMLCVLGGVATAFAFRISVLRTFEALRDLLYSLGYYVCKMCHLPFRVKPTVTAMPSLGKRLHTAFPYTFTGLRAGLKRWGKLLIDTDNLHAYFGGVGNAVRIICILAIICIPLVILLVIALKAALRRENNDYNYDSKPLSVYKQFEKAVVCRVINAIKSFVTFMRSHRIYVKIFVCVWLLNLNVFTVIGEFFAFLLYVVASLRFSQIYKQLYKLFLDLSVPFSSVPWWLWTIAGLWLFARFRRKIAYARLQHMEMCNRGFINAQPISLMLDGTMGKGKTTAAADMALSQEAMFRDKALTMLLENDCKFPYFPWINLENELITAIDHHQVYNLATVKRWVRKKAARWHKCKTAANCFDYDFMRYGFTYNDKLKVQDLWEVIETYALLYFIYVIMSSLILSNFSIRTDAQLQSIGNFPLWNSDFFHRDSARIDETSRHAHILDFDMLRLGRKVMEHNMRADSFDFGVIAITEVGKERGNNLENQEKKKKDDATNQKNDLFNVALKMIRHPSSVDNYPFVKVITDEQRSASWGADARDLCNIIHIRDRGEMHLTLPFFSLAELLHDFVFGKFSDMYYSYRFTRSDNTLIMYLLKKIATAVHRYYTHTYNLFGFCMLKLQVERGTQDGTMKDAKYYLMTKKIYSKRFSTDCYSDFFAEKALRSPVGIDDLPEYATEKATFDELRQQNSYFISDLVNGLLNKKDDKEQQHEKEK